MVLVQHAAAPGCPRQGSRTLMGWLDGSSERKASQLLLPVNDGTQNIITIPVFGGQPKPNLDGVLYPDATYASSASAGYGRNELVYACIRERGENLPQSVLRVYSYGYILDPSTSARNVTSAIIPIDSRDMIHVKYPNPLNAYFGQPPLRPAARAVSLDNAATDFVDTLLRNYAVPGV